MNKRRQTQIISYLLAASLLLSFWVCVEECQADFENNRDAGFSVSQNIRAENTDADSCSVQTAPSAVFSNQESFALTNFSLLPHQSRKPIFQQMSAPVIGSGSRKREKI